MAAKNSVGHPLLAMAFFCVSACGYSQQEWDQKLRDGQQLSTELGEQQRLVASCKTEQQSANSRLTSLRDEMMKQGLDPDHLTRDLGKRQVATEEYELRTQQLGQLKSEFTRLKQGLLPLQNRGVTVLVRANRLVVRIPGGALFAAGTANLTGGGNELLSSVAKALRAEPRFGHRALQIGAHTDSRLAPGSSMSDNWQLSALQARSVLVALSKALTTVGGAFAQRGWSAAGYGNEDPISTDDSLASRSRNHRIEILLQPRTDEMLNLGSLAATL